MFSHGFGVSWRKALVSLPRLVPDFVLHLTSPDGPHPIALDLPSRDAHLIPIYVFIPPGHSLQRHHHQHRARPRSRAGTHLQEGLQRENEHDNDDNDDSENDSDNKLKLPVLIDFHGGGFVLGSCQEQAPFCAHMCRELNCVVISVDYRLGPAAQYPAANLDAEDVVLAVIDSGTPAYQALRAGIQQHLQREGRWRITLDEERIAFSGFSSGGNLALNLALSVRDDPTVDKHRDWPSPVPWTFRNPLPLLLFYPSLDCRLLPHERPRPHGVDADAPPGFVERWRIEAELMPTYLPVAQRGHPRASPGLADIGADDEAEREEQSHGLHPQARMLLVLPQFDSLHAQSVAWVQKVHDQGRGRDLTVQEFQGVVHGWTQFPDSWLGDEARRAKYEAFAQASRFLRDAWNPEGLEVDVQVDVAVAAGG